MDMDDSFSPLAQANYIQKKLETFYYKIYANLYRYRNALLFLREVLVWKRPWSAILLYLAIHGAFVYVIQNPQWTLLSLVGSGILWCLMIDAFMRAALRDEKALFASSKSQPKPTAFDRAILEMDNPQKFETICLKVAQGWCWLDNLRLSLCYLCIKEPLSFAVLLAVPGFALSVVGKLVPTVVMAYIGVMAVTVYPLVGFHEQQKKLADFLNVYCPRLVEGTGRLLASMQNLLNSMSAEDNPELSLDVGGDRETQEALAAEFQQAMTRPGAREVVARPPEAQTPATTAPADPISLENTPFGSVSNLDGSLSGTPLCSVSNLDSSLNLPSFTPQMWEQQLHRRDPLDPFTDSLDLSSNFTDSGGVYPLPLPRPGMHLPRVDEADESSSSLPPPPPYEREPPPPYHHQHRHAHTPKSKSSPQPSGLALRYRTPAQK